MKFDPWISSGWWSGCREVVVKSKGEREMEGGVGEDGGEEARRRKREGGKR